MSPLLEIQGLRAGYTDVDVLQDISLHVDEGEIVAIIGPNGAGKSTVLNGVMGFLNVRAGGIVLNGKNLLDTPTERLLGEGISYVPQVENVFPSLTVYENLEVAISERNGRERIQHVFDLFPRLEERRRSRARTLSGGERQMLALGRALMSRPKILLLDEPSAALSPGLTREVFGRVADINSQGTAVLLVEQNARQALKLADRAYILDNGKNALHGTGAELLDDPRVGRLYLGG